MTSERPDIAPPAGTTVPDARHDEIGSIARALGTAYTHMVRFNQEQLKLSPAEAERRARAAHYTADDLAEDRARTFDRPADEVSWWDLARLAERDPDAVVVAWERIKSEARKELHSGHRTAQALEWGNKPWDRARYLAIRQSFLEAWRPRHGIEAALVELLAQNFTAYLQWTERLTVQAETEGQVEDLTRKREGYWQPPRIGVAEAMDQSAVMADRAHRTYLRTLKALQDLRRLTPAVYVGSASQINVGGQQVNVAPSTITDASDG